MNDDILAKIRKCMALSASSNEHEAAAALRQARALMEKHGLTEEQVAAAEASSRATKAGAQKRPPAWEAYLARRIAEVFGCTVIFRAGTWFNGPAQWNFIGTGATPEVAGYCCEVLLRQLKKARAAHLRTALKRCKATTKTRRADLFCEGWVASAFHKVEAMTIGGREQAAIDAYLALKCTALRDLKTNDRNAGKASLSGRDYADYAAGRISGKDAQLNRGMGADAAPLALE